MSISGNDMGRSKEAELISALLMYAVRCLAEGDHAALRSLNFGAREVQALRELGLTDLQRVGTVHGHCLDIQLNRESYWLIVEHLRRERETEDIQYALIRADAPFDMIQALFGLDSRTYTGQRSLAGVRPTVGRPPTRDEETSQRLISGRRAGLGKPAIVGLMGFANLMRAVWGGARADDPYADWWLVRTVLTARHVGLVESAEAERSLHLSGRQVRRAFSSPLGYRFLGVTRADLSRVPPRRSGPGNFLANHPIRS